MREIGMPFRPDMAAALRNGTKTQTRRRMDPQPPQWADGREIRHIKDDLWGLFAVHGERCRLPIGGHHALPLARRGSDLG